LGKKINHGTSHHLFQIPHAVPQQSPKTRYDATFIKYDEVDGSHGTDDSVTYPWTAENTSTSNGFLRPQTQVVPKSIADADVKKLESYKNFARFLDEKVRLETLSNDLMTKLREVDWKLKRKEVRLNGAKDLLINDGVIVKVLSLLAL
jgi:hypothetical protein